MFLVGYEALFRLKERVLEINDNFIVTLQITPYSVILFIFFFLIFLFIVTIVKLVTDILKLHWAELRLSILWSWFSDDRFDNLHTFDFFSFIIVLRKAISSGILDVLDADLTTFTAFLNIMVTKCP